MLPSEMDLIKYLIVGQYRVYSYYCFDVAEEMERQDMNIIEEGIVKRIQPVCSLSFELVHRMYERTKFDIVYRHI
jgi:hypothetical protein